MQTSRLYRTGCALLVVAVLVILPSTGSTTENGPEAASGAERLRDPFWPVGYVPREVKAAIASEQLAVKEKAQAKALVQWPTLSLVGITKASDGNVGLIQGVGLVEKGDSIRMSRDGVVYKWVITNVSEEGLSYKRISATPISLTNARPRREPGSE